MGKILKSSSSKYASEETDPPDSNVRELLESYIQKKKKSLGLSIPEPDSRLCTE